MELGVRQSMNKIMREDLAEPGPRVLFPWFPWSSCSLSFLISSSASSIWVFMNIIIFGWMGGLGWVEQGKKQARQRQKCKCKGKGGAYLCRVSLSAWMEKAKGKREKGKRGRLQLRGLFQKGV